MLKYEEATNPESCWNRAKPAELVFVLLERDAVAADTVRFWCDARIRSGRNKPNDPQIVDARKWADRAERTHARRRAEGAAPPLDPPPPDPPVSDAPLPYPPGPPPDRSGVPAWADWWDRVSAWWAEFRRRNPDPAVPPTMEFQPVAEPVQPPYRVSLWLNWTHARDYYAWTLPDVQDLVRNLGIRYGVGASPPAAVQVWDNADQRWLDPSGKPIPTNPDGSSAESRCPLELKIHTTNLLL